MKNLSIRTRIILLVVLAALPALVLTVYSAWNEGARAEADAREDLTRLAKLAAQQQAQIVEGAKQMLAAISLVPPAVLKDQRRCNQYLAQMLRKTSGIYHSLGIYRADGLLICNAIPWQGKIYSPDRLYFRLTVSTGKFAVGEYQVGRVTKRQGINFGYPITDEQGKVTEIGFVAIDVARFNQVAVATPLPDGGTMAVIDREGIILARYPEATGQIGQPLGNPEALAIVLGRSPHGPRVVDRHLETVGSFPSSPALPPEGEGSAWLPSPSGRGTEGEGRLVGRAGAFESTGADGIARLFAFDSVAENPDGSIPVRILISIPVSVIYEEAHQALIRNLSGIAVATVLLLVAAWIGAEVFILRSIRALLRAVKGVHTGRLSSRTGLIHGDDELGQLGSAFDEMTLALQNREAAFNRAMQDLQQQAVTDPLTGLYNRRFLYDALPRELSRSQRKGTSTAVLMADIDYFKRVNDTYGHEFGDLVLKAVADAIKATVRSGDYCFRYGGEEFSIVMPEVGANGAQTRAEAIRAAVQSLEVSSPSKSIVKITISIGIAIFPDHGTDADSLLHAADAALYEAKGAGRNRVLICDRTTAPRNKAPVNVSEPLIRS